jgi:hypothetical protein
MKLRRLIPFLLFLASLWFNTRTEASLLKRTSTVDLRATTTFAYNATDGTLTSRDCVSAQWICAGRLRHGRGFNLS